MDLYQTLLDNDASEKQTDREEIRRKLAMESDNEECSNATPKLKFQEGTNLQICFMNDTYSDHDGHVTEQDIDAKMNFKEKSFEQKPSFSTPVKLHNNTKKELESFSNKNSQCFVIKRQRPLFFFNRPKSLQLNSVLKISKEKPEQEKKEDIVARHARLYREARIALAQAKEVARMQMELEKLKKKKSPISEIVGIILPDGNNKFSRLSLADMNVAQLQVIVNDLHTQIENLNEELMRLLLERDDLHMEQDSKLVDIEDFTRYLGLKIPDSKCSESSNGHKRSQKSNGAKRQHVIKVKNIHVS